MAPFIPRPGAEEEPEQDNALPKPAEKKADKIPTAPPSRKTLPTSPTRTNTSSGLPGPAPTPTPRVPARETSSLPTAPPVRPQPRPTPAPTESVQERIVTPPIHRPERPPVVVQPEPEYGTEDAVEDKPLSYSADDLRDAADRLQTERATRVPPITLSRDDDEEEVVKPKKKKNSKKRSQEKQEKSRVVKKGNQRRNILIMRYVVLGAAVILIGIGLKSIVVPPSLPSPDTILSTIQEMEGRTNFPAEQGRGFAQAFTKAYLTINTEDTGQRDGALERFTEEGSFEGAGLSFPADQNQNILDGPYIYGIRFVDDTNAIYTVGAETDTMGWIYLNVSVFYNENTRSFIIPQGPSLASPPKRSVMPIENRTETTDEEATATAEDTVISFFTAWASGDNSALNVVLAPTADARAHNGLENKFQFDSLSDFNVEVQEDPSINTYIATTKVNWTRGTEDNQIRFTSAYQLLLIRTGDGKWYVQDVLPLQFQGEVNSGGGTNNPETEETEAPPTEEEPTEESTDGTTDPQATE